MRAKGYELKCRGFFSYMIAFKMSCHSRKVSSAPVQYFIAIIRIKKYS
jgi:hypothetical protein